MTDQPAADPLDEIEAALKPYRGRLPSHERLPTEGRPREEILEELRVMAHEERAAWQEGRVSGAVYEGAAEHVAFLNEAYAIHSQSNPLHLDVWPSAAKFEAEIVSMTAAMLGAIGGLASVQPFEPALAHSQSTQSAAPELSRVPG